MGTPGRKKPSGIAVKLPPDELAVHMRGLAERRARAEEFARIVGEAYERIFGGEAVFSRKSKES